MKEPPVYERWMSALQDEMRKQGVDEDTADRIMRELRTIMEGGSRA